MNLVRENIRPSDILTRKAFENAVTLVVAMGGSTNTALHLPAIANEMGVKLSLKDIHDISMKTPLLADMKPGGKYLMFDLDKVGGVQLVMKRLLDAGLLHGDELTITGKTVKENLKNINTNDSENEIVKNVSSPLSKTGGLVTLFGNLAPDGCVLKVAGHRIGTAELESSLVSHNDVVESAVCGIPDEIKGDSIIAFIVLKEGANIPSELLKIELIDTVRNSVGPIATPSDFYFCLLYTSDAADE